MTRPGSWKIFPEESHVKSAPICTHRCSCNHQDLCPTQPRFMSHSIPSYAQHQEAPWIAWSFFRRGFSFLGMVLDNVTVFLRWHVLVILLTLWLNLFEKGLFYLFLFVRKRETCWRYLCDRKFCLLLLFSEQSACYILAFDEMSGLWFAAQMEDKWLCLYL